MEFIYLLSKYSHIRQELYLSSDRIQEQHGYQRVCTVKLPNTNSLAHYGRFWKSRYQTNIGSQRHIDVLGPNQDHV